MALVISGEIHRRAPLQRKFRHAANLRAVVRPARIFAERCFLSVAQEIRAGDMMEMAHLTTTQAGEIAFRLVRASLAIRIRFLMVDALHFIL